MATIVKTAIRSLAGWTANQVEMEALYGVDGYKTLLSTWISDIPLDLVAVDEQWVAECYNDWPTGLDGYTVISGITTDATRNIIISGAYLEGTEGSSRADGTADSGFLKIYTASKYHSVFRVWNDNVTIDGIRVKHDTSEGLTVQGDIDLYNDTNILTITNCVLLTGAISNASGFKNVDNTVSIINNVVCIGLNTAFNYTSTTNCTVVDCAVGYTNNIAINCVSFNNTVDFNNSNVTSANNASNIIGEASCIITDLTDTDFVDIANDNYNLSYNSKLHGGGTDIGLTSDIIAKDYRAFNGTTYIPIGAFNGLSVFTAIRVDQTAFDTLSPLDQARYEGHWQSLLSTWESNDIPADLTVGNVQAVAECYNDWPTTGLVDIFETSTVRVTNSINNTVITSPLSDRHTGISKTGFYVRANTRWVLRVYDCVEISFIEIINDYDSYGAICIRIKDVIDSKIHGCILVNNATTADVPSALNIDNVYGTSYTNYTYNNLIVGNKGSGIRAQDGLIYLQNNTIECANGTGINNSGGAGFNFYNNNVVTASLIDYAIDFTGDNNATHNSSSSFAGVTVFDIADSDFTDPSIGDYSVPTGSKLIDAGTDLSTDFTTDIIGTIRG